MKNNIGISCNTQSCTLNLEHNDKKIKNIIKIPCVDKWRPNANT